MRYIDQLRESVFSAWCIADKMGFKEMAEQLKSCLEEVDARRMGRYEEKSDADGS